MGADLIAVTGATGQVGSRVARRLAAAGARQRLIVRDPSRAPRLDGVDIALAASYRDVDAMRRALDGTATMFLVSAREAADRVRDHTSAVDAAVAAGVERIVYLSFAAAAPDATFTFARDHWHTERYIRGTGQRFTFLRDNLYLQAFTLFAGGDGAINGPAGDGRAAAVAHDDIADVAAAVLQSDEHDGATYDVTGPEALSLYDVAEELRRVTGRTVTYRPETEEEAYASRSGYGAPEFEVAGWVTSYQAIANGDLSEVTETVQRLAGHVPRSFAEYLRTHPESYRDLVQ